VRSASLGIGVLTFALLYGGVADAAPPSVPACLDASEQGQDLRDKGKLTKAAALFETCAAASCPAPVRASCAKWQAEIAESMPSIIVAARDDADADVVGATLSIDGGPGANVSGRAITLDPGPHTLVVTAPRYEKAEQKLVVTTAEKNRIVRIRLATLEAAPPAPAAPPPAKSSSGVPVLALGLGGLAVASGVVSLAVGLGARGDLSDLHNAPCAATRTCPADETSDIKKRLLIADVALGVAVVAAAAAVYFWLTTPSHTKTASVTSR
jgi:hypothetical protein